MLLILEEEICWYKDGGYFKLYRKNMYDWSKGIFVETGIFAAHMEVSLVNDGPITLIVDSK